MGKQPFFDDAALQAAATQTAESLLSSLPAPSACQHVFSELFLEKMRRLRRRYSWKKAGRTAGRYAAAILLTASLTLGAIMAVSPQARAGIMQWVREKQENRIIYRFYKEQTQAPMDDSSIPVVTPEEGCTIIHTEVNGCPADFYQMPDDKDGNVLVILDEEANIMFGIAGNIDRDSIFNIAEHIVLDKTTKN